MSLKSLSILLADDHAVVRDSLKIALETDPRIRIIGEAQNGEEAVALTRELQPDLVVMDIDMPVLNGIEASRHIRSFNPDVRILMLTMHENEEYLHDALQAGINGYVLKMTGLEAFLDTVRSVAAGHEVYGDHVARMVRRRRTHGSVHDIDESPFRRLLTRREREIIGELALGKTSVEIARHLSISPNTVNNHRKNIMQKLQCHNTAALISQAAEMGIISQR